MAHDLIRRVETLGHPRILVVGDLILDRYVWGDRRADQPGGAGPAAPGRPPRAPARRRGQRRHDAPRPRGRGPARSACVGRDPEAVLVRRLLADLAIDDGLVVRPRRPADHAQGALHRPGPGPPPAADDPRRLRDPRPDPRRGRIGRSWKQLAEAVAEADVVLICDYDKGVCTPSLLRSLIAACRSLDVRVIADPIRSNDYAKYRGRPLHDPQPARSAARDRA